MKNQFVGLHLDFIGFTASLFCAIHCAFIPILVSLTPLAGLSFLANPWTEYAIILISFFIASMALIKGYRNHLRPLGLLIVMTGFTLIAAGHLPSMHHAEIILTSLGALFVAIAHLINWKDLRKQTEH